ncbi:MAG TPA: GNAT family N-acetyltransferase [Burkholderiales bacterium]|nr:GNAT family N-acetyltransferase [Burkholderiales bacterium]
MKIRRAARSDVPALVALLADDVLGAQRERNEDPVPRCYYEAFDAIAADANHELLVAEVEGRIVATLQLTFLPGLSRQGLWRAQIEGVRVSSRERGRRIGELLVRHAIERAREEGCGLVQLTSDKRRKDAVRFYERLGFVASHEGMKLALD